MADEVDAALNMMRQQFGAGDPATSRPTGDLVRTAGEGRSTGAWEGNGKDGYNGRAQTNQVDGSRLAGTDDKVPPKVAESAEETNQGRRNIDRTAASYQNGKAALAPVRGTAAGETAMLGLKTSKLSEGAGEVAARRRGQTDRAAKIRAYSAQMARAQSQQQQAGQMARMQQQMQARMQQQMMTQAAAQAAQQMAAQGANAASQAGNAAGPALQAANRGTPPPGLRGTQGARGPGSSAGKRIVEEALKELGKPYVWGGGGKDGPTGGGFDCSSLAMHATYQATGVELPRTTYDQINRGVRVNPSDVQPGDLVFSNFSRPGVPEHVSIAMGGGKIIEAPQPGGHVQISNMPSNVIIKRNVQ